jgi:septal ring factor EnvC (AmiA/AmiB activator)
MGSSILGQRKLLDSSFGDGDESERGDLAGHIAALEGEIRKSREEFAKLRNMLVEREKKGATLTEAYRSVLADMARLIEAQSDENTKREESLRFFLNSIESRLKTDIRSELGIEPEEPDETQSD